jgi:hypothetical protein
MAPMASAANVLQMGTDLSDINTLLIEVDGGRDMAMLPSELFFSSMIGLFSNSIQCKRRWMMICL